MSTRIVLAFLIPFFILAGTQHVWPQKVNPHALPDFHSEHYTDEDGLPQNSVYSIAEDELGFIWLATERGLVRFDGKNFKVFDNFGKTFEAAIIRSFHIDPRPQATGFFAMNQDQNFIHIDQGRAVIDTSLFEKLKTQPFPYPRKGTGYVSERLPTLVYGNPYRNFYVVPAGADRFFVYNQQTLDYYDKKKKMGRLNWAGKSIWQFFRLNNNLYHFENGKLTRFPAGPVPFSAEQAHIKGELIGNPFYQQSKDVAVFWNNAMNQTFIVAGQSLYHMKPEANGDLTSELILQNFNFQKEEIRAIYYNQKTGRIFLGSQLNGLLVFTKNKFLSLAKNFPGADQVYYGQAPMGTNSVLSSQGIAYSMDGATGKASARQLTLVTNQVFWDKSSILVDGEGYIWCKHQNKLMVIERDGSRMKFSWTLPSEISQLYQGADKTIWIATTYSGLFFLKTPFADHSSPVLFLKGPLTNISYIAEQPSGTISVGTGHGLFYIARKTSSVSKIKGLEGLYIRSLHISPDGAETWITTYKNGFYLLKNRKLTHFPFDAKSYLANAHCIIEDSKGFFWITTNRGLFQILKKDLLEYAEKPRELYYHLYSKTDGFNTNEFNGGCQPCALRLPSGFVSLPSMNGLIWFKPERTTAEVPDKKILIDQIEIDRKIVPAGQKQVIFPQSQKQLKLQFSTPFFGNQNNVEFSYALEEKGKTPTSSDWLTVDVTTANTATITISTLSKGRYTLYVRKMNGFGTGNYGFETVDIDVPPLWFQTWWFYLLALFTFIISSLVYSKYRIRAIQQRNRLLELQVGERTSQLQVTLRDLETSQNELLSQMHLQSRLMASIAHDVRSPLGAAIIVSDEMQKMIERGQYDMVSLFGKNIADAIRRVKGSLEELLAYVKIQVYKYEPKAEKIALYDLLEENMQLYGKNTRINANTFLNLVPVDSFVVTNAQLLKIIVHNLIDNANKFTDSGLIKAYVTKEDDRLRLIIEDSGRGIPRELIEWFKTGPALPEATSHGGIGLAMVKELAPAVAENIWIERLNQGTRVTIVFHAFSSNPESTGATTIQAP